ncbi:MAG: BMP family ABC transporter substrate-binding protein [Actinobacteria bacterium]|nr:MAG: BMP family ABC transporter substrate-binding protein [Actinomycetota bacterium]
MFRRWWIWGAAAAVVVAGLVTWLVWPAPAQPPPRARVYLEYTACLLTDQHGVAGSPARSVWDGMEDASLATHAQVQYDAVMGEQSLGNALPYLSSMVDRRCGVVLAVGAAPTAAVGAVAAKYPGVRFVVVDGTATGGNVTGLRGLSGPQLRDRVRVLVTGAVRSATPR